MLPPYSPIVPTLVREPFHRPGWIYEEKIDGWRMLAYKDGDLVRLVSRNGVEHTRRFRDLAEAVASLTPRTLVLDAEVAIFDQQLRSRLRDPDPDAVATPPLLMAFDVLYVAGRDQTPLRERALLTPAASPPMVPLMSINASDDLPARLVGPWSKEKLRVVGSYMGIFTGSMKAKWKGLTYVDLFAGPGVCVVEDTGEELLGSPLLALDTKKPFDKIICVEQDDEARAALDRRVRRHPRGNTAEVVPGDCNVIIGDVVNRMPSGFLSLVFIDPEGVSGLDADTTRALAARHLFVDLIVLFPQQMSVNRNRWQWVGAVEDTPLDRVLGGRDWRTNPTPEVVQFMELLRSLGFVFVESAGQAFRNRRGAQLYYLVFASKSLTAANFWAKISRDEAQSTLF